ncbi:ATP-dependent RNA helicase mak5, putative [Entamoeba invadens IP1]|uniref:ATP-dependent RNA helicase mak5, putative n=1 Tax=Entamoeba invadens IP1 TaxID=370355 RepID=A0A0A1U7M8_ENTIV|nr:ATP-dependent RNA helicase mak5, putative [Entamoeba invadens IP1]ELP89056.1 ATP-dependent RNA helicase mak5, putative [Entamoeba invadens IP1]|eukprot:XP_004255827.1 ATP-dependent RNA helicase mak5, putative [Entamoeba invadens IP1]
MSEENGAKHIGDEIKKEESEDVKDEVKMDLEDDPNDIVEEVQKPNAMEEEPISDADLYIEMKEWRKLYKIDITILRALYDLGFIYPTEIQKFAIPKALTSQKDLIGSAPTGSGKTLSFLIPLVQRFIEKGTFDTTQCLILVPTRELAVQIRDHLQKLTKYLPRVTSCVVVGGLASVKQVRLLLQEPTIVIGTPGRIFELYNNQDTPVLKTLPSLPYLVVDEADRMVEPGHFSELKDLVTVVSNAEKQTFVFSATMQLAAEMWAAKFKTTQTTQMEMMVSALNMKDTELVDISTPEQTAKEMEEKKITVTGKLRDEALFYVLTKLNPGKTLVFVNAITMVKRVVPLLQMVNIKVSSLYSGMEMAQRLRNIERFTKNENTVLVTTDIAARGLDIDDIKTVIHYDLPRTSELYVHRSGRTARAGRKGTCIVFVVKEEKGKYLKMLENLKKSDFPQIKIDAQGFVMTKKIMVLANKIIDKNNTKKKGGVVKRDQKEIEDSDEEGLDPAEQEDDRVHNEKREKLERLQNYNMKEQLQDLLKKYQIVKLAGSEKGSYLMGLKMEGMSGKDHYVKGKEKREMKRKHFVTVKGLDLDDLDEQINFAKTLAKKKY